MKRGTSEDATLDETGSLDFVNKGSGAKVFGSWAPGSVPGYVAKGDYRQVEDGTIYVQLISTNMSRAKAQWCSDGVQPVVDSFTVTSPVVGSHEYKGSTFTHGSKDWYVDETHYLLLFEDI